MFYFICASPLVKIYLPEWHRRLEENPELIFDYETPFEFTIATGTSGIRVKFNTPQQVTGPDQRQNESRYLWLTGGPQGTECQETDHYGIVQFNPKLDMAETFDALQQLDDYVSEDEKKVKAAKKKAAALREEARDKMRSARDAVRIASEARVKRAIKFNHNNLIRQWQLNEEMKLGKYPPSISEMLGAHAIDQELQNEESRKAELKKRTSRLMQNTVV